MSSRPYYLRNHYLLDDPKTNLTFHRVLSLAKEELTAWIDHVRSEVVRVWAEHETPPLSALATDDEINHNLRDLAHCNVNALQRDGNMLNAASGPRSCINQFFPTMWQTTINYCLDPKAGCSVYDLFANRHLREKFHKSCRDHFRFDSFHHYSKSVLANTHFKDTLPPAPTGYQWVRNYFDYAWLFEGYNFWLKPDEDTDKVGSSYAHVDTSQLLWLSKQDINRLPLSETQRANAGPLRDGVRYYIRVYRTQDQIFPMGFTAFKIGDIQISNNFPPLIAKFLYEKYTEDCKTQDRVVVYDPSSGWGGRIAGAMCVKTDRRLHYVGTDPNTDNYLDDLRKSRYEYLAERINAAIAERGNLRAFFGEPTAHTYHLFQCRAQKIHQLPEFQQYRGKVDFVFTSPPYFNREGYSDDRTQSHIEFPEYDNWRDGFLKPTLKTCAEYLRPNRFLAWNVADINIGGKPINLEAASRNYLEKDLGLKFVRCEEMALGNMPGANRVDKDGRATAKNSRKVDGKERKTEPIFIFWKGPGKPPTLGS